MKTIFQLKFSIVIVILTLIFSIDTYGQGKGKAQGPPSWAPAHGYRANTNYVYFPDQNFYFDVQNSAYICLSGDNWQVTASLPASFSSVNLSIAAHVELDLSTNTPQQYNGEHKVKYKDKSKNKSAKGKSKKN